MVNVLRLIYYEFKLFLFLIHGGGVNTLRFFKYSFEFHFKIFKKIKKLYRSVNSGGMDEFSLRVLYILTRYYRPKIIVETGVSWGFSSFTLLTALKLNRVGHLYSIDLPHKLGEKNKIGNSIIPSEKTSGFIVPHSLRLNWDLILGKSKAKLPELLKKLGEINFFIHDSEHSYENMMFEYKTSYSKIKKKGFLMSHDVLKNNAFKDFCKSRQVYERKLFNFGLLRK